LSTNVYEGMFILDANRYARDAGGVANQISALITKCGGEVVVSRLWEERRLAYPIKGQRKGTYWLTYFNLDPAQVATLTRETQLNDNILRCLFVKIDARIADALISHATAGPQVAKPAAPPTPSVPVEALDPVVQEAIEA
jgi:small subunit ribosomal protein S6